jgi:hypothetical protein
MVGKHQNQKNRAKSYCLVRLKLFLPDHLQIHKNTHLYTHIYKESTYDRCGRGVVVTGNGIVVLRCLGLVDFVLIGTVCVIICLLVLV